MKELKWVIKDADGKVVSWASSRQPMRDSKKWYEENIFDNPWIFDNYKFPLKLIREEWELIDERVVR